MNIAELSIKKSLITWVMTVLMVVVGIKAYGGLARLEDPEFTIKDGVILTPYPGASATEVEEEVSNVIEKAAQQLGQLLRVESRSERGFSIVKVTIKDKYDASSLPQVWDELRRKVGDAQRQLPPGAGPSLVNDDFGDVYGMYVTITGPGYTHKELTDYAELLQRELLQAKDVKRIVLYGVQREVVYVEMNRQKMAELGISPNDLYRSLASKNMPASAGHVTLGSEYIPVNPTGEFTSEEQFGDLLITAPGRGSDRLVFLRDVATITRGYQDPPKNLIRYDGVPGIGLAISAVKGGNVVEMGDALAGRFEELRAMAPLGMELNVVTLQSAEVKKSIDGFLINLIEAVLIVVVVLLFFMGLRSGLIIGSVLFITISATFIFMSMYDIMLERISLGALVIALGMLVDNAIVVTDGMRMKMDKGQDALSAAKEVVGQTSTPLLGATVVAITAFAAIGTSQDATGEFCRSLFQVIMISLLLSWVTAVTVTPLLCKAFLKSGSSSEGEGADPYDGGIYNIYRGFLSFCLKARWLTVGVVLIMFGTAMVGFGYVDQMFFPASTRPQFYVDFWFPEGTHIRDTEKELAKAEDFIKSQEGVEHVITTVGGGQIRFMLTFTPENPYSSFGQIMINVDNYKQIAELFPKVQKGLEELLPDAVVHSRLLALGPSTGGKVQLRISGPDPVVLRELGEEAQRVMNGDPLAMGVRSEWRNKVKTVRPELSEAQARRAGITRPMLANALATAFEGAPIGVYRENDKLLPIVARAPESERGNFESLDALQIWSPAAQQMIPVGQVVSRFRTETEDPFIWRRNRSKMLRIHADPVFGTLPSELFARIKPQVEKVLNVDVGKVLGKTIPQGQDPFAEFDARTITVKDADLLPLAGMPGYSMAWGGEAEDSARAQGALQSSLPTFLGLMVLIIIFLFNSLKKPAIIWLCVPLAVIGVTAGLLLLGQPFGFMALLGLLSLSGMLIKNAIVLIDQIDFEIASGKKPFQSIVDSGVSRLMPVAMAAITTIMGMAPLLADAFFVSMAVTIMFGLGFATILTLIMVPVFYAIFFGVAAE